MPRIPLYVLIWSKRHSRYDLYTQGHLEQGFPPGDADAWLAWLETVTSFAFRGACGSLNVYQEARRRAGRYWYAYATTSNRTRKRYLGRTTSVTFARLEEVAKALGSESSPTPLVPELTQDERDAASHQALPVTPCEVSHGMEVLSTKLSHPQLPSRLLARERLLRRLDAARFHRLTLLSATAGWGKTTLLSTWASRSSFPIAWLSLDELDNDPVRFWVLVLTALRTCLPGVGETALAMLRSPQPPSLTSILTTILNDLRAVAEPTVLLLDDYHLIDEPTIHHSMLFVLDHLPAHLHLVLSSRVDPPLALSRWRARGQLLELRDADLRFQEEEAARFLTHTMGLPLEAEEVAQLARRIEGWIAGLQLAALSLQHRHDRSAFVHGFTGSHRYVLDYVQEEILARLQTPLRDFLLHISILSRMSASLCQAVTAQSGLQESEALLKQVERANFFLVPLDEERRWYRFHDLFREALLACLYATQPELIPLLHRRAARWYEAQGEFREAIAHALEAGDFSCAVRLMEQTAEQFSLRGEATTLSRWVRALPDAVVREHAPLVLTVALYLIGETTPTVDGQQSRAHQEAQQLMARVEMTLLHQENGTSLYVVALHQAGKTEQARAVAVRLFALTEPEGYVRVYLDVGRPMQQTLQSILTAAPDHTERTSALSRSALARLVAAFAHEEQMRAVRAAAPPARPQAVSPLLSPRLSGVAPSTPALLEPLTPQEQRVLQLLAEGASNQQIATQLVIQLVTVKKHLTNLLGKLGAANRTQALVRAREYGLL